MSGHRVPLFSLSHFFFRALADFALTTLTANLVTSFVYSDHVVSWLSLGSVCDLMNAASWLCEAEQEVGAGLGVVTIWARWTVWVREKEDPHWVGCFSFFLLLFIWLKGVIDLSSLSQCRRR